MSKIRLYGDTSGYLELDVPAVAGDRSLILPDVNGNFVLGSNTFKLPGSSGTLDSLNRAGNVLQVVNATYSVSTSSSSTTYSDTGLTATITPTSATSKILVTVLQAGCGKAGLAQLGLNLMRGATQLFEFEREGGYTGANDTNTANAAGCTYLDSPATTAPVTYKTQFKTYSGPTVYVQASNAISTITLMEIAA